MNESPFTEPEFEEALVYATRLHRHQVRKGSAIPYVAHPLGVAALVLQDGGSREEAIAALLHDAAEDHGGQARLDEIRARFGTAVASIVEGCSDSLAAERAGREPWRPRKLRYLQHLESANASVLRVTCADKLDNARAILADQRRLGDEIFTRFEAHKAGTLAYYALVLGVLRRRWPGALTDELDRVVSELWGRAAGSQPWPRSENDLPEPPLHPPPVRSPS